MTLKPFANAQLSSRLDTVLKLVVFATILWLLSVVLTGCVSTVIPQPVARTQASYDPSDTVKPTSGVIMSVPSGFVVTSHFRERLNSLIATYGGDFPIALKPDHQIAPIGEDRWLISKKGMEDFLLMADWKTAGLKPQN